MSPQRVTETMEIMSPSPSLCRVHPLAFVEGKRKGQSVVRCVKRDQDNAVVAAFEANVNTLDGIYRLMSHHMGLSGVETEIYDVLKNMEEGDRNVVEDESGAANQAIECYTRVLKSLDQNSKLESKISRGLILTKRSQGWLN